MDRRSFVRAAACLTLGPATQNSAKKFAELAAAVRGKGRLSVTLEEEIAVHETLLLASGVA